MDSSVNRFEPIAIVGEGCVLPGAMSPADLWDIVRDRRIVTRPVPAACLGLSDGSEHSARFTSGFINGTYPECGGPQDDPVCAWPIAAARAAWAQADTASLDPQRCVVILANLFYPSRGLTAYAEDIWRTGQSACAPEAARNSGYPAFAVAEAIGAKGAAFALDAACASSLYALEIGCRKLAAREADAVLAGAVNAADNLILHIGFDALKALSPTGRSRPFIAGADGLVPSEGAVAVVLKRLSDVTPGETVHGVIRGIGLSNDGRQKGLLAPDAGGQMRAMRQAYRESGVDPSSIAFLECHATGTAVGDGVEIQAASEIFSGSGSLPVGSLKANTGHLITAAGLASVLKLMRALAAETLPAMPLDGDLILPLHNSGLRPLAAPEPWKRPAKAPRRAAISNFGFGGNNAHLVLEQYEARASYVNGASVKDVRQQPEPIAVCGIGLLGGEDAGERAVLRRLMNAPVKASRSGAELTVDPVTARTPPTDLVRSEAPQLAILAVASEALSGVTRPEASACGAFTAIRSLPDSARWLLRARASLPDHANDDARDLIAPPLIAADVLGAMGNVSANRLNVAEDFRGQGFALAAEAASGAAALDVACAALRGGRLDLAIVIGADFATDPVSAATLPSGSLPGEKAAGLVLKRLSRAEADNDRILAVLDPVEWHGANVKSCQLTSSTYGSAPAADLLFDLGVRIALAARGQTLTDTGAVPALEGEPGAALVTTGAERLSRPASLSVRPCPPRPCPDPLRPPPYMVWAAAGSRPALAKKLSSNMTGGRGSVRIALIAASPEELDALRANAALELKGGRIPQGAGVHFGEGDPEGELAFVFTGSAAAYPRMGRALLMAFPEVAAELGKLSRAQEFAPLLTRPTLTEFEQLCAVSLVTQAHAILLRDLLGIKPDAALGLSLGESNALFAFGYWRDMGGLLSDIEDAAMYERHIGGSFETARESWGPNVPADWTNWRVSAPCGEVRQALACEPNVELTIIYSDTDCMIGGPADACRRVAAHLPKGAAVLMHQHLIVHARAMQPFAEAWRRLHSRPVSRIKGPRLYTNATNTAYKPSKARTADMLTRQALATVDFPATVRQAWQDGVRTFVELGPRDTLTRSIQQTLGDKPHRAVATDKVDSSALAQIAELAAALYSEGWPTRIDFVARRLEEARENAWRAPPVSSFKRAARLPAPILPRASSQQRGLAFPVAPDLPAPVYTASPQEQPPVRSVRFPPPPGARPSLPKPRSILCGNTPLPSRKPSGPAWSRPDIEASTRGHMSALFGERFAGQDRYPRQVRLPAPPLLLVDRITGLDAPAGVEGTGVIWTETDLETEAWYLAGDRIRPGPLIECGQADLTLIGWMGADLRNRSERVYRLLGCEITFHEGGLPEAGDTLRFQIEITQHATFAGVRMFFFQYDCTASGRPAFSVRQGQAGFFTDAELASGKGIAWDAATSPAPTIAATPPDIRQASRKRAFTADDVGALRAGDAYRCFGEGFEACAAQSFPPRLPDGPLALFDRVDAFDPLGGPWGRGYLRAVADVPRSAWFYDGHFHNDPCMPGTLMAEAAVQALEFHAAALGLARERDGYVFEPVPGMIAKFICRGQVVPDQDHEITYEVFIDEVIDGETPHVFATLLASCKGRKIFLCPRFGIRLIRRWPAPRRDRHPLRVGPQGESRGDQAALLDCANGAPSAAFGPLYAPFDTEGRVPRLPQPPYHMMSRVTEVSTRPGQRVAGAQVTAEYDIAPDAWYFADNAHNGMPLSVLSEIALQPCGWLASHCGFALDGGDRFRNLEGDGTLHRTVRPDDGLIRVNTGLTSFSKVGPMTIVGFTLSARLASGIPVLDLDTRFGFFPAPALARQAGLPMTQGDRSYHDAKGSAGDFSPNDPRLPSGQLRMIDRVDIFEPEGGRAGLGLVRGRQTIDPYAWYFKAHFFTDPVQPGSLGLDALVQLLIRASLLKGLIPDDPHGRIETPAAGAPVRWTYRGQVTPQNREVVTVMELTRIDEEGGRRIITGRGSLWCDGLRIYEASPLSIAVALSSS